MANPEHLAKIKEGVEAWNLWRKENPDVGSDLSGADLSRADLTEATLVNTNLEGANMTACVVYGISAWNVRLEEAIQSELLITQVGEPEIYVDNLEVAQFIYLLLNNEKIRAVIDTITSKVVLILGRFTPDRKVILDAIREELRKRGYLPVLFDFEKPRSLTTVETVTTLARMARFAIADLSRQERSPGTSGCCSTQSIWRSPTVAPCLSGGARDVRFHPQVSMGARNPSLHGPSNTVGGAK